MAMKEALCCMRRAFMAGRNRWMERSSGERKVLRPS